MRKLLASKTATGAVFQADIDPETYDYFLLRISGTQAAAQFLAIGEVGHVFYRHGSQVIVDADFDMIHFMNEKIGGEVECTGDTAINLPFAMSVFIPRGYGDGTVEAVETTDRAQITLQFGPNFTASVVAGALVELYGVTVDAGEENYSLYMIQLNQDFSAASKDRRVVPQDNVVAIYTDRGWGVNNGTAKSLLITPSANFTELAIKKDGQESSSIQVGVLQSMSNWDNRIEGSYVRCFETKLARLGEITEVLSDDVVITTTATGAVVVRHLILSAVFDSKKRDRTVQASGEVVKAKVARKLRAGKIEEVFTLQQLAAA